MYNNISRRFEKTKWNKTNIRGSTVRRDYIWIKNEVLILNVIYHIPMCLSVVDVCSRGPERHCENFHWNVLMCSFWTFLFGSASLKPISMTKCARNSLIKSFYWKLKFFKMKGEKNLFCFISQFFDHVCSLHLEIQHTMFICLCTTDWLDKMMRLSANMWNNVHFSKWKVVAHSTELLWNEKSENKSAMQWSM